MTLGNRSVTTLAELTADQREEALARWAVLRLHLEEGVPLPQAAAEAGVGVRTVQRWLAKYRTSGLVSLARPARADAGRRKFPPEVVGLIEGLALRKPQPSVAAIYRRVTAVAHAQGWSLPSYGCVYSIVRSLAPALVTLAQAGPAAFRDRFELVYRRQAENPNALWQADHTELDILILDANGVAARPWLTTVIDDYSRAVAGYLSFLGAPSALNTSLALRQAIWRKSDPAWPVCGIPEVLYVDHGSDFTSHHLDQVASDLRFRLVYSTVARPQGRGKVERLFGTLNTELLPELPGHLVHGKPATPPRLSLSELDAAIGAFIVGTYHMRAHRETGTPPGMAWLGNGWLPRMPDSLEELDLLLVMVAKSRVVHRDGIHFQGLRYIDPTLAAYVGESITLRYDPRDLAEIRVFHHNDCVASPGHTFFVPDEKSPLRRDELFRPRPSPLNSPRPGKGSEHRSQMTLRPFVGLVRRLRPPLTRRPAAVTPGSSGFRGLLDTLAFASLPVSQRRFLCRAISLEHAGQSLTFKDIQAARLAHRRALREQIKERIACVADCLSDPARETTCPTAAPPQGQSSTKLRTYLEDK